ncbi:MAG: uroporphyrinogen-III synthase, partial [Flavobacteriales bacterium]
NIAFRFPDEKHDWIFFSSANGVKAIIAKGETVLSEYKIGCIGQATADALPKNFKAHFIGEGSTAKVSRDFRKTLSTATCIFIEGKQSLNTVQKEIRQQQYSSVVVYKTRSNHVQVPEVDCYFFTSPSNVKSFAESNSLDQLKNVIAMGTSTQAALLDLGIPSSVPKSFQHSDQFQTIIAQTLSL